MTQIIIRALQLLLSLFIITVIHEFGHYLWARFFGMKIERLQIFGFSLFSWRSKRTGTKYGIGWLPLGGFCQVPDLHTDKSPWKKLHVYSGGVINNIILAFVIFMCIAWFRTPSMSGHAHIATERGLHMISHSIQNYSNAVATSSPSEARGLLSLGKVFSPTWNWFGFWYITAYYSMAMAVFNLIPIPGLDGGQITFTAIEAIIRRPINEKVKICANITGLLLVLAFIIYGNYNDIRLLIRWL